MTQAYLSLGSNIGDREKNLEGALAGLELNQVRIIHRSSIYESEPQDVAEQPWFLNMVVGCETSCTPLQLLAVLNSIEIDLGRDRTAELPRGPRIIDIDILLFGEDRINLPSLIVPHPRMCKRRFVLEPLLEIAPQLNAPLTSRRLKRELRATKEQQIKKIGAHSSSSRPDRLPTA